jgi:hypothetical protein
MRALRFLETSVIIYQSTGRNIALDLTLQKIQSDGWYSVTRIFHNYFSNRSLRCWQYIVIILGVLEKLRKATIRFAIFVCPSFWIFFENLLRKFKFDCNMTGMTSTLHEDLGAVMTISRWILLSMRNVSDKSCRKSHNSYFTLNNFFPKTVPFMIWYGKTWQGRKEHRWRKNTAHA